jgi:hypothetical protein
MSSQVSVTMIVDQALKGAAEPQKREQGKI